MVNCGYKFDIIILNITKPNAEDDEASNYTVEVSFNDFTIKITTSRINVSEFLEGYTYEFEQNTETLREDMAPLELIVNYDEELLGNATFVWPEEVLHQLETMTEVMHSEHCELINDNEVVGSIDILIRIQPKCQEPEEGGDDTDGDAPTNIENLQDKLKELIKENDLLFVVGGKKYLESCEGELVLEEFPEVDPIALDLAQFRDFSGRLVPTPSALNTCCNPDCCGLKKLAKKQPGFSMHDKLTCGGVNLISKRKPGKIKCLVCTGSNSDEEEAESSAESSCDIGDVQWGGHAPPKVCLDTPPPELTQTIHVTPKCCPVCRTNIDWLPALSVCPKCNYKPVPIVEDAPYNPCITAGEILRDFMNRERPSDPIDCRAAVHQVDDEDDDEGCQCNAETGKTSANSHIRKACENVSQSNNVEEKRECTKDQKVENTCDESTQLTRVFGEIINLFEKIDAIQKKSGNKPDKCSKLLNDYEEQELKRKMFDPIRNYEKPLAECKNLEAMRQRMSKCESLFPECNQPVDGQDACKKRKKKIKFTKCNYPCPLRKIVTVPKINVGKRSNVPSNMGWLWKLDSHAKQGWKPGAVSRRVRNIMAFFLKGYPPDTFKLGARCPRKKPDRSQVPQKPTLHICKRNDEIYVTLQPLANPDIFKGCIPAKLKPIHFKIQKNPELLELRKVRDQLLKMGFCPCVCGRPIASCRCRDPCEKIRLLCELMKECCNRGLGNCSDRIVLNEDEDSEAEYEVDVTPPAGMIKRSDPCKPKIATHGTQYVEGDWTVIIPPKYLQPEDVTAKKYDCALQNKFEKRIRQKAPPKTKTNKKSKKK